ncbi:hypothetical protein A3709_19375 [Halioglobus sp. HI00S01]|uniref:hypothetical protein n=1 Tax=Halioglobus sp. HI00S01 TaxID=1822214 RepID=UPI0007C30A6C|nr:hypothetical protein [Halioglobus sp. HI00S01]KZX57786.1 hypothetical protein A3709_19375 [Halioglobus sp. HI00S01]
MVDVTEGILAMPLELACSDELSARQVISAQRTHITELNAKLAYSPGGDCLSYQELAEEYSKVMHEVERLKEQVLELQEHRDNAWEGSGGMPSYSELEAQVRAGTTAIYDLYMSHKRLLEEAKEVLKQSTGNDLATDTRRHALLVALEGKDECHGE